jgi:hypothetical protein
MRLLDGHDAHLNPINLRPAPICLTVSQEATVPSNHGNVLAACEWRLVRTGSFQRPEQRQQVTTATTKWCSFKGREDGRREDLRRRGAPTTTTAMLLVPASPVLSPVMSPVNAVEQEAKVAQEDTQGFEGPDGGLRPAATVPGANAVRALSSLSPPLASSPPLLCCCFRCVAVVAGGCWVVVQGLKHAAGSASKSPLADATRRGPRFELKGACVLFRAMFKVHGPRNCLSFIITALGIFWFFIADSASSRRAAKIAMLLVLIRAV